MSPEAVAFYRADDSGYGLNPKPGSTVGSGDRIVLEVHNLIHRNLSGSSLRSITVQYQKALSKQLSELDVGSEWVDIPDLGEFMRNHVLRAALTAMFGPYLLQLNPTFIEDFWAWNSDMGPLFMGLPRWLVPGAYQRREKVLQSIMRWHRFAHGYSDCSKSGDNDEDWEPYFGSKFSRKRQTTFGKWQAMDDRAKAAEDFSFIWASNANSGFASIWFLLEILRDPTILARVQREFDPAMQLPEDSSVVPTYDIDEVCSGPLSQSIYAEILRLRVSVLICRKAKADMDFDGWDIKAGENMCFASTTEGLNEEIWNAGTDANPHPLKSFWADRFLVYPNDETSGPLKRQLSTKLHAVTTKPTTEFTDAEDSNTPRYSMEGLTNSWLPYSGGARLCPGRHFAKQEIIVTAAMMLAAFEIQLRTEPDWIPESDPEYYGFGTMPPKGKIPVRIRRRGFKFD